MSSCILSSALSKPCCALGSERLKIVGGGGGGDKILSCFTKPKQIQPQCVGMVKLLQLYWLLRQHRVETVSGGEKKVD